MASCQDCNFFTPNQWSNRDAVADGECRRHPPVASLTRDGKRQFAKFPSVANEDWCGEFVEWPAPLGERATNQANAAFDAASQQDATDANVGATVGECQIGRAPGAFREILGTPPENR